MAMTLADFRAHMRDNTDKNIADIKTVIGKVEVTVAEHTAKLDRHEATIRANQAQIAEMRLEIRTAKESITTKAAGDQAPKTPRSSGQEETDYDLARRTVRIWPVVGTTPDQVWQAARTFLVGNLRLTDVGMEAVHSVTRATTASGPGVNNEVIVTFKEMHTRDQVMGAAAMLSTYMDANGRATAGLRMQVPPSLQSHFRILFKFGQSLRMRHGQGTRRHIKFDDALRSLYLNVKLPGDERWSRVSVEVARRGLSARGCHGRRGNREKVGHHRSHARQNPVNLPQHTTNGHRPWRPPMESEANIHLTSNRRKW